MSVLQDKFNAIVKKIEDRIEDEELLSFVKQQVADISILFIDQLDKVVDLSQRRLDELIDHEKDLTKKVTQLEQTMKAMEKEFYVDESFDFEIVCPYCNYEFVSDFSQNLKEQVECPECHNIIELDWNNHEEHDCSGHCSCCDSECEETEEEEIQQEQKNRKELKIEMPNYEENQSENGQEEEEVEENDDEDDM